MTSGCPWPSDTVKSPGSHPCPENHVPKKFQVLDHVKPPVRNPGPKIEIPHLENHVLKVFRFRSWKPRVWKSRPQSWDPKSWKPCPENHILKFPRPQSWDPKSWKPYPKISHVFLGLGNPKCKLQVSKNWGSHVLKIMSKKFPSLGLGPCTSQNWNLTSWKSCP